MKTERSENMTATKSREGGPSQVTASLKHARLPNDPSPEASWPKLRRSDWLALGAFVIVLASITVGNLPSGVCFSDGGDLQLASTTLGVMHPPGYAGYVSLLHILTYVPGVEPAYMVSIGCLAAGIVALTLVALVMIRLGANPWVAGAILLSLILWPNTKYFLWFNLVAPEVYGISLALTFGTVYLLMRFARVEKVRDLYAAALILGVLIANRPTAIYMLPFIIIVWWMTSRSARLRPKTAFKRLGVCVLLSALPGFYSLGYLWVRDTNTTAYNYLEHFNAEFKVLPEANEGPAAKWTRLKWHVTAREFAQYMTFSWRDTNRRLTYVYKLFFLYMPWQFCFAMLLLVGGAVITWIRCRTSFVLLIGVATANLIFICTYKLSGQAGDLSPLLMTAAVFLGVVVSQVLPRKGRTPAARTSFVLMLVTSAYAVWVAPEIGKRKSEDAAQYIRDIDMASLPQRAVICSSWHESPALWYAKYVMTGREDITIINTVQYKWRERLEQLRGRPVFCVTDSLELEEFDPQRFRVVPRGDGEEVLLWRLAKLEP